MSFQPMADDERRQLGIASDGNAEFFRSLIEEQRKMFLERATLPQDKTLTHASHIYALCALDERLDTQVHLPFLKDSAKGTILEIGVWTGISTAALLSGVEEHGGHVYSVDIYAGSRYVWHGHQDWTFLNTSSHNVAEILKVVPVPLDLLFIDGEHSYEGCLADLENWVPQVRPGGLILVHDADTPAFPGVRKAIDEFCDRNGGMRHELRQGSNGLEVIWV